MAFTTNGQSSPRSIDLGTTDSQGDQTEDNDIPGEVDTSQLKRFPFWNSVAEHDYRVDQSRLTQSVADRYPTLSPNDYYVDPFHSDRRDTTRKQLSRLEHAVVFGAPGSGKTTLRYALESRLRGQPNGTLVVTYNLDGRKNDEIALDKHYECLVEALTADLLIQIVEQFCDTDIFTTEQNEALGMLLRVYGVGIRQVVRHLAEDKPEDHSKVWGFAELWQRLERPVVRPVRRSPELQAWLMDILDQWSQADETPVLSSRDAWQTALAAARMWGFEHTLVMVDAEDRGNSVKVKPIRTLLENLNLFAADGVYLKFFLPEDIRHNVLKLIENQAQSGGPHLEPMTLRWDDDSLQRLMRERFRAVDSDRIDFTDLVTPQRCSNRDYFLTKAYGSPRRLVRSVMRFIEEHKEQQSQSEKADRLPKSPEPDPLGEEEIPGSKQLPIIVSTD